MNLKTLSNHWTWGITSSVLALPFVAGLSASADLVVGWPFGSTIINTIANPNSFCQLVARPFFLFVAGVALVLWIENVVWDYRNRSKSSD